MIEWMYCQERDCLFASSQCTDAEGNHLEHRVKILPGSEYPILVVSDYPLLPESKGARRLRTLRELDLLVQGIESKAGRT